MVTLNKEGRQDERCPRDPVDSNPASPIVGYTIHQTRRKVTTPIAAENERYHRPNSGVHPVHLMRKTPIH